MNKLTNNYLDIELNTYDRKEKKRKLAKLLSEIVYTNYSLNDINNLIDELLIKNIPIRQPLFAELIYPIVSMYVEQENITAIKLFIKLEQPLYSYQNFKKDFKFTSRQLIINGITIDPNDNDLLHMYEKDTRDYINHTLHELPVGVIYGMNGATIEECSELIEMLSEYENVCKKLHKDESKLIMEARYYYTQYQEYLKVHINYHNFSEYLRLKKIY